jgi:type I restriction enzyme R subunit
MFNESNTVEALIRDLLCGPLPKTPQPAVLPRQPQEVLVEAYVRDALIRLNPAIAAKPERADEVIYKLRAIVLAVRSDGLVRANEELTAWLRGERSMPFGPNHEHVTIRLLDFDDLANNQYVATTQYTFRAGPAERRADLILLVNGFPLVLIEAKTPVRAAVSWVDGALQRLQRRHRGQRLSLWLHSPAGRTLGTVAARRRQCARWPGRCQKGRGVAAAAWRVA